MEGAQLFHPDNAITRNLLERRAEQTPDETFLLFEDGSRWTYREALAVAYAAANALRAAGIRQGDRVCLFFHNGPEFLRAWWGAAMLGAAIVPIHTGFRGAMLEHLLRLARAAAIVGDPALLGALDDIADRTILPPRRLLDADLHSANREPPALERPIETWDTQFCLLTSGTTGPSKLAACTYRSTATGARVIVSPLRERDPSLRGRDDPLRKGDERLLLDLPMYHGSALRAVHGCLVKGASLAVRASPRLSNYWELIEETGVTMSFLVSSMVSFVLAQPPHPSERRHRLRVMGANPLPPDPKGFMERFGLEQLHVQYGSTELPGSILAAADDDLVPGYCGRLQPGYQCRLVDESDIEVPAGKPGELIMRHEQPWVIASEYLGNAEATARAWRNGWFHTGDMMRREPDGRFFFVDRVKDSLRRRGENISSAEVEAQVLAFPGLREAACVASREPGMADDEVKVWVVPEDGRDIDFAALLRFCARRLPYFMVPRYFERIDALPRTPIQRIRKMELRERGNGPATWDREAQGFRVTRAGLHEPA